jgi:hypothetical protein
MATGSIHYKDFKVKSTEELAQEAAWELEKKIPQLKAKLELVTEDLFATPEKPQPKNLALQLGELATSLREFKKEASEHSETAIASSELDGKFRALQLSLGKGEERMHVIPAVSQESKELGEKTLERLNLNIKKLAEIFMSNRTVLSPEKEKEVDVLIVQIENDYGTMNTVGKAELETDKELAELNGTIEGLKDIKKVLLRGRTPMSTARAA